MFTLILIKANAQDSFSLGVSAYDRGNFEEAYELFEKAANQYFSQDSLFAYADAHLRMADCRLQDGDPFQAKGLSSNTLEFIRKEEPNDVLESRGLTLLGLSYLNLGRNDEALEFLLESEKRLPNLETKNAAECLDALGLVYRNMENRELATQYHERAFRIRRKLFGVESIEAANSFNNLGLVYLKSDPLQALIYFNRAEKIYTDKLGNSSRRSLRANLNIAFANREQKNFEEAIRILTNVKLIYDAAYGSIHPNKAYILSVLGRTYLEKGDYEKALQSEKEALQMYLSLFGEKHPDVANSYFLLGEIMRARANYREAVDLYQLSIYANIPDQTFIDIYDLPSLANYFDSNVLLTSLRGKAVALADLHFEKTLNVKDIRGAIETYRKCDDLINLMRRNRLNEQDKLNLSAIAKDVYENGMQLSLILSDQSFNRKKYIEQAFNFCERSKSAILLEAIMETKAKKFAGIPEDQIVLEDSLKDEISYLEQQLALRENADNQELKDLLFSFQNEYLAFIDRLEKEFPNYYQLKYRRQFASLESIQNNLAEKEALLSYFLGDSALIVFVTTKKKLEAFQIEKIPNFEKKINALRNAIKYNSAKTFLTVAQELHLQLIPKLPADVNQLIIIPDGVLGTIPFEALVVPKEAINDYSDAGFLLEDYHISYDFSASLFTERADYSVDKEKDILLIAPIDFSQHHEQISNLPGSEKEIDDLRFLFLGNGKDVSMLSGAEATEFRLKNEDLSNYRYLHFATHGYVNESEPALSKILLQPDSVDDGSLFSGELYNLKLGADLVTLSACETGLGKVAKGEGIVGLTRALQYAGARNVIVSLWQVSDQSTAELMNSFYTYNINNTSYGYNTALRQAKLTLLESEKYNRPYFWAPFILIGK